MGDEAKNLAKATDAVLRAVVEAAVAGVEAKKARAPGSGRDVFSFAQAHRAAEKRAHDLLDATIQAAAAAWEAGDITLEAPPGSGT